MILRLNHKNQVLIQIPLEGKIFSRHRKNRSFFTTKYRQRIFKSDHPQQVFLLFFALIGNNQTMVKYTNLDIVTSLLKLIVVALFLSILTPLVYDPNLFFPYVTTKNFYFRILVELAFAAYLILATAHSAYRPRKSPILIAMILFGLLIGLASLFGIDPYRSFWSNFERMEGYITLLHLMALFLVASAVLNQAETWSLIWKTSLGTSVIVGLTALKVSGGALGNSSFLAVYMLMHVFLAGFLWLQQKKERYRFLYALAACFDFFTLYQTGCRGAFLGFSAGLLFTMTLLIVFEKISVRKAILFSLGFACILAIILKLFIATNWVQNNATMMRFIVPIHEILHGNLKRFSEHESGERFSVWTNALQGIQQRPWLGFGPENFNYVFNLRYPDKMINQAEWFDRVHNTPLEWLVAGGILGLAAYLSLFMTLLYVLWKKLKSEFSVPQQTILTGLLLAYFVHNLFVFDHISSYLIFFFLLAYIHSRYTHQQEILKPVVNPLAAYLMTPPLVVSLCFVIYSANFKPFMVSRLLHDTELAHPADELLSDYQEALSYHTFDQLAIREKILQTTLEAVDLKDTPSGLKRSLFDLSNAEFVKQIAETPQDTRAYENYGAFLSKLGLYDQAIYHFQKALIFSPGKLDILLGLGSAYFAKNDLENALSYYKKAFEQAPQIEVTRICYALIAVFSHQEDLVVQLLSDPAASTSTRQAVISKIEKVIRVEPSLRSQGEYFINRIQSML